MISMAIAAWIIATSGVLVVFGATQYILGSVIGSAIAGINLAVLVWTMKKIFQKKSVALAMGVIVIKYLALIVGLTLIHKMGWSLDLGFAIGVSAVFPCIGYIAYKNGKEKIQVGL